MLINWFYDSMSYVPNANIDNFANSNYVTITTHAIIYYLAMCASRNVAYNPKCLSTNNILMHMRCGATDANVKSKNIPCLIYIMGVILMTITHFIVANYIIKLLIINLDTFPLSVLFDFQYMIFTSHV